MTDEITPPSDHVAPPDEGRHEIDDLAAVFLGTLRERGVAGLLMYSFAVGGKPVARIKSNTNPTGTQAALDWLNSMGERSVEAAARVLTYEVNPNADQITKQRFVGIARKMLESARAVATGNKVA